jgi:hypothetical protein
MLRKILRFIFTLGGLLGRKPKKPDDGQPPETRYPLW